MASSWPLLWTTREENRNMKKTTQQPLQLFNSTSLECDRKELIFWEAMKKSNSSRCSTIPIFDITPPTTKSGTPITPNAPSKPRKCFSKTGRKIQPRKLFYAENQRDNEDKRVMDEKYYPNNSTISTNLAANRKESSRSRGKSTGTVPKNRSPKMSEKENRKRDRGRLEKQIQQSAKKNDSVRPSHSSQLKDDYPVKGLKRLPSTLSRCDDTESWQNRLLWLQPRRDVGVVIQCCRDNCRKWRYCDDYHNPTDVPEIWYCEMNSDKTIASCHVMEVKHSEEMEEDLIENKYNAGSIVWGHVKGYPWWPAIVDDCPNTYRYYELRKPSIIPIKYHVTFLEDKLQHAWLTPRCIKPFAKNQALMKNIIFHNVDYKTQLKKACTLARSAIRLSIFERLNKFSYVSRYMYISGLEQIQDNDTAIISDDFLDDDEDEVILGTPSHYMTLRDHWKKRQNSIDNEII